MPGELTNVWATSGAKPESLSACQSLLSPVVAMQGGTAATQLPDQSLWNTGTGSHCSAQLWDGQLGWAEAKELHGDAGAAPESTKGCLGFIPTPLL